MIIHRRLVPGLAGLVLVVAACGGSATSAATPEVGAPAASAAAASEAAVAAGEPPPTSAAPSEAAAPDAPAPAGGGGTATDVCGLVTGDELAGILGTAVTTAVLVGPPDTCDVQSTDGAPLAAFVLTKMSGVSASFVYDSYAGSPTATEIGGIGEKAAYDPSQGALVVLKNGAVLSIAVFDDGSGSTDEATRLDQMKRIGSAAAGRM